VTDRGDIFYIADPIENSSPENFIQKLISTTYFQYANDGDFEFPENMNSDNTLFLSDYEF
jgi:hypothetical protein